MIQTELLSDSATLPVYHESVRIDLQVGFRCNYHKKTDNDIHLHSHDYYELFFLPDHSCEHFANNISTILPGGSLLFIRPNDCHDFINVQKETITIMQVAISKTIIESLFEFLGSDFPSVELLSAPQPPYAVLNAHESDEVINLINELNAIPFDNYKTKTLTMRTFLAIVFPKYFSEQRLSSNGHQTPPQWLSYTYNEMKKIENFHYGINRMVELSGYSKEHLCRSIKKYYQCTAMEYINDLRLTYIANMLIDSTEEVSDLCYESGFSNLSWMYSLFQKKYGVSPAKFRKEYAFIPPKINKKGFGQ